MMRHDPERFERDVYYNRKGVVRKPITIRSNRQRCMCSTVIDCAYVIKKGFNEHWLIAPHHFDHTGAEMFEDSKFLHFHKKYSKNVHLQKIIMVGFIFKSATCIWNQ